MKRFWDKVAIESLYSCWEWQASRVPKGYGSFRFNGRATQAHRVAYTLLRGEIPKGLVIDHLCRNPSCVNVFHLEAVTSGENVRRGYSAKTHCASGLHPRTSGHGCKLCRELRYRNNIDAYKRWHKEYRANNRERLASYGRQWRKDNQERIMGYRKAEKAKRRERRKSAKECA